MPAFPTFAAGNTMFWPCVTRRTYKNLHVENGVGQRFSYNERATPLMSWEWQDTILGDDDLATLRAFWESVGGAYEDFTFTDPDTSIAYAKCRFVGDELSVRHIGPNENAVTVSFKELV